MHQMRIAFERRVRAVACLRTAASLAILAAVGLASVAPVSAQMRTPVETTVTPFGAASARIPIRVPPGVAGLEPKLSLAYSSQAGSGILGWGWSIGGLSSITRCPQTTYQDGARASVAYTLADRFCMDGQRMVLVAGAYGADGSEYRTEVERFDKITAHSGAGNGPARFTVRKKSGYVYEYGATADSRIEAAGKSSARVWALDKVTDERGNTLAYSYVEDAATGSYRLARIDYAYSGATPLAAVLFEYEARTDWISRYIGGSRVAAPLRLTRIVTQASPAPGAAQQPQRLYRVAYDTSSVSSHSRVASITECDGSGTLCLAPVEIGWDAADPPNRFSKFHAFTRQGYTTAENLQAIGDFDGDGLEDIVSVGMGFYRNNRGDGTYALVPWTGSAASYGSNRIVDSQVSDMNGDGRLDVVVVWGQCPAPQYGCSSFGLNVDVFLNVDGTGRFTKANWLAFGNVVEGAFRVIPPADFNGDGRPDLALAVRSTVSDPSCGTCQTQVIRLYTYINNGGAGLTLRNQYQGGPGSWPANLTLTVFDVEGDGAADVIMLADHGQLVTLSKIKNDGTVASLVPLGSHGVGGIDARWTAGDVNGDGLTDLLRIYDESYAVSMDVLVNTGGAFTRQKWLDRQGRWEKTVLSFQCRDVNGDGTCEPVRIVYTEPAYRTAVDVYLANRDQFTPLRWLDGDDSPAGKWLATDVRGDGLTGFARVYPDSGYHSAKVLVPSVASRDLVASIGHAGQTRSFAYETLTRLGGMQYFRDEAQAFPRVHYFAPLRVVSRATHYSGHALAPKVLTYSYGTAVYEHGGRQFLGLRWMQVADNGTALVTRQYFRLDFPYLGRIERSGVGTSSAAWANLRSTQYTHGCRDYVNASGCAVAVARRYFVYESGVVEQEWDLDGSHVRRISATGQFDAYGNEAERSIDYLSADGAPSGYRDTVSSVYSNDAVNWRIGRLLRTTTRSTSPNDAASIPPP